MEDLTALAQIEAFVFAWALLALVAFGLLTARINVKGLLLDKTTGQISPERIQLLVFTLTVASMMLFRVDPMNHLRTLLLPSGNLLAVLSASHLIYLARKYQRFRSLRTKGEA